MECHQVWVLGGTGRSGRAIAERLPDADVVLVGRDEARLKAVGIGSTLVAGTVEQMAAAIRRERPRVVVHTVGPFARTAEPIARACVEAGAHYLDLANDVEAASAVLALDAGGSTLVTGAGFGVTAAEAVVAHLCRAEPTPTSVRVDTAPSLALTEGVLGEALAATLVEGLADAAGRRYRDGVLVRSRLAGDPNHLHLPDGAEVTAVSVPLGDLVAAQRASGAPDVVAGSTEVPSWPLLPLAVPVASALLRIGPLRRLAVRRLAAVRTPAKERPRAHSWAHATVRWSDGRVRDGWLQLGDASKFTAAVPAEIVRRLLAGEGTPGATTPVALFGTELAKTCGGQFL